MDRYTVLTPLRHDGRCHESGGVVCLPPHQAASLLRVAAVAPHRPPRIDPSLGSEGEEVTDRPIQDRLDRGLNPDDPTQWRRDGRPRTAVLTALLGHRVSVEQRDRLWRQWKKRRHDTKEPAR